MQRAPLWSLVYAVLAIATMLVVVQLLGIVAFSNALISILYVLVFFALMATVFHLARLI
jgi:hypothetical protein